MAEHDRWDTERDDRREPRREAPRHERAYEEGGFSHAPRIGPTGIANTTSPTGNWATTGRFYEDYQGRADYGGFEGGAPQLGPGDHGEGRPHEGRRGEPRREGRYGRRDIAEEERRIGGPYTDYGRAAGPYADYGRESGGYGAGGGYAREPSEGLGRERRSWRDAPEPQGEHRGRGPKGYKRSDSRIHEDVNDRLTDDPLVDATEIVVVVEAGEVTLNGTVPNRQAKRRAEDCAEEVTGVSHVQNNLRVNPEYKPGTVGAQTDPRIAAVSEGRDTDEVAQERRHQGEQR